MFAMPSGAPSVPATESDDFLPTFGDPTQDHAPVRPVDDRTPEERTAELFEAMQPCRRELLGILRRCLEPALAEEAFAAADEVPGRHGRVYTSEALCGLLERSGALERLEEGDAGPRTVVVDGVEYLEPAGQLTVRYRTTPVGAAVVEADRPAERVERVLRNEAEFAPIFVRILEACAEDGGKTAKELGALVDHDPLLQRPRRWAAHFFGQLGEAGALVWDGTWQITEVGRVALEDLRAL